MDILFIIINLVVIVGAMGGILVYQHKNHITFTRRVFTALILGIVAGAAMQLIYGPKAAVTGTTITWLNIIGNGYVRMLQMIVIPLIFVSITSAIVNLKDLKTLGKYGVSIITVLIVTTAISAAIGIGTTLGFGLDANNIAAGVAEEARTEYLETRSEEVNASTISSKIIEVIPTNVFAAFSGTGSNATLSVVVFSMFVGTAGLAAKKKHGAEAEFFVKIINSLQTVVMGIVDIVLKVTPFGILALMTRFLATSNFVEISALGVFIIASYIALALIIVVHMIILAMHGLNPFTFIKKSATVLIFSFTSRSSAAAIPLTVKTQEKKLGVPEGIASLAASFGASIGQNGCAGMYPAMLAVMIAPAVGVNPLDPLFLVQLIVIVAISSFGVAGVGGGATFAALIVLSAMNLPVGLAGVLISIEPLIDMGRTLVNVSDSLLAGVVTAKRSGELNLDTYNSNDKAAEIVAE